VATVARFACVTALLATCAAALPQGARQDQVFRIDPRRGVVTISGLIEQHALDKVVVVKADKGQVRVDSAEVIEVVFGEVPPAFTDAVRYLDRKDFENAVARFRVAAGDASARPVVQGRARLRAAETLLVWGASDPTRFREAAEEAGRFLEAFADDRSVPRAKAVQGRAQVLAGDAAAGAGTLGALFETGQAGTVGYAPVLTLEAGLDAAFASLSAGDRVKARTLFDSVGSAAGAVPAERLDAAGRASVAGIREVAALGAGFVTLAEGQGDRAEAAFRGKPEAQQTGRGRAAAQLGLGQAYLLQSKFREAQLTFASAATLSYADEDNAAAALVGLGQAYSGLGEAANAKQSFERVQRDYGDTPPAARATELLRSL